MSPGAAGSNPPRKPWLPGRGEEWDVPERACKARSRRRVLVQARKHVGLQGRGARARDSERAAVQAQSCAAARACPSKTTVVCERCTNSPARLCDEHACTCTRACTGGRARARPCAARTPAAACEHTRTHSCMPAVVQVCQRELSHTKNHRQLHCRGDKDRNTRCHLFPAVPPPPYTGPSGLSTDTLVTLTELQIAFAGLRKCWGACRVKTE